MKTIKLLALAGMIGARLFAAGIVSQSLVPLGTTGNYALTFYWQGDAVTGSVPATVAQLPPAQGLRILEVEVVPGAPTPTNGMSVALKDPFGGDLMVGTMSSVSNAAPQFFSATSATPPLVGTFTLSISGQVAAGAQGQVVVYFGPTTLVNATAGAPGPQGPTGPAGPTGATGGGLPAANYTFSQAPGGSLSSGANTVTLTPVPAGVNGSDASHYVWISGGTGTAEACPISGGTAVAGANTGTVIITCANTHSGAWTISSATAGIQEAIQAAQTAGGGMISAGGSSVLTANSNITISGSHITLWVSGKGINFPGTSLAVSGSDNTVMGTGQTPLTATTTAGDVITLTGCQLCTIKGLLLTRSATPAVSGAGINIASGDNNNLKVTSVSSRLHYRGVWAQIAPVVSAWTDLEVEHNVVEGIRFDQDNDEHLVNVVSNYNGGNGIQVGKGVGTTNCIGGFRISNAVMYSNGGDGLHIEGAAGNGCTYIFVDNLHADSDAGYELFIKNSSAVSITSSQFVNGNGGWIGDGAGSVFLSSARFQGSHKEGLYITNGASLVTASGTTISDSSQGSSFGYPALHINNSAANINLTGTFIAQPDTTASYGILIETGTGGPSGVHMLGTQLSATGNMTTPVSIASGLTDVFVDSSSGGFITLSTQNSWTATVTPGARLEANGNVVRIRGTIQAGTTTDSTVVFTLPVGMRPSAARAIPIVTLSGGGTPNGSATLSIATDGTCAIYGAGSATFLRLDSVSFALN